MNALWGMGLMSLTKLIVVVDKDGKVVGFGDGQAYKLKPAQYVKGGKISDADAAAAVTDMQKQLPAGQFQLYVNSSSPEAYKDY